MTVRSFRVITKTANAHAGTHGKGSPPVPDRAALAPARVRSPPSFRCRAARWLEMVDVHTLCFHIKSVFLYKSKRDARRGKKDRGISFHSEHLFICFGHLEVCLYLYLCLQKRNHFFLSEE